MSAVIRWETPRAALRGPSAAGAPNPEHERWLPVAADLRERPGEWAVIFEGHDGRAAGLAQTVKVGGMAAWKPGGTFEAVNRRINGVSTVYARYVGGETP